MRAYNALPVELSVRAVYSHTQSSPCFHCTSSLATVDGVQMTAALRTAKSH